MAPRVTIDWEMVEPEWRAGVKSLSQICVWYEKATGKTITKPAISKHFKKLGVPRDLTAKIRAKADAIVNASIVSDSVNGETKLKDKSLIEANAKVQADIVISHRKDIPLKRELVNKLFAELEQLTDGKDIIKEMACALKGADLVKLSEIARKVTSLPSRIKGLSDLVGSYKHLVALEREAFNVQPADGDPKQELKKIIEEFI
ncbi:hypothetical protein KAR91_33725 [Candidatus Pacearchaeota archaeon]|nr:hypothetical protein [Candidatus Pacearchaeota archaeon]